jgi:hypothetical protein
MVLFLSVWMLKRTQIFEFVNNLKVAILPKRCYHSRLWRQFGSLRKIDSFSNLIVKGSNCWMVSD